MYALYRTLAKIYIELNLNAGATKIFANFLFTVLRNLLINFSINVNRNSLVWSDLDSNFSAGSRLDLPTQNTHWQTIRPGPTSARKGTLNLCLVFGWTDINFVMLFILFIWQGAWPQWANQNVWQCVFGTSQVGTLIETKSMTKAISIPYLNLKSHPTL